MLLEERLPLGELDLGDLDAAGEIDEGLLEGRDLILVLLELGPGLLEPPRGLLECPSPPARSRARPW